MRAAHEMGIADLEAIEAAHAQEANLACDCPYCKEAAGRRGEVYDPNAHNGSLLPPNGR